jgi:hypothetical protein
VTDVKAGGALLDPGTPKPGGPVDGTPTVVDELDDDLLFPHRCSQSSSFSKLFPLPLHPPKKKYLHSESSRLK